MKWDSRWSNHAKYTSACMATSVTRGVVHWEIYEGRACTGRTVVNFLKELMKTYPGPHDKIAILADNCKIHKTEAVLKYCERRDITWIMNIKHRPDFNGIEGVWGWTKKVYRERLDWFRANGIRWKQAEVISKILEEIP
jgi:transposase